MLQDCDRITAHLFFPPRIIPPDIAAVTSEITKSLNSNYFQTCIQPQHKGELTAQWKN